MGTWKILGCTCSDPSVVTITASCRGQWKFVSVVSNETLNRKNQIEEGKESSDETIGRNFVTVVADSGGGSPGFHHEKSDEESELCRICLMSTTAADVMYLGCSCKLELGRAHKGCADTWFRSKGTRRCEICGKIAKNVHIPNFFYFVRWVKDFVNQYMV